MKVTFGETFARYYLNFPKADQAKIRAFVNDVETYGLTGLQGRNKNSDNVPKMTLRAEKAKHCFARSQDKGYARSGAKECLRPKA